MNIILYNGSVYVFYAYTYSQSQKRTSTPYKIKLKNIKKQQSPELMNGISCYDI